MPLVTLVAKNTVISSWHKCKHTILITVFTNLLYVPNAAKAKTIIKMNHWKCEPTGRTEKISLHIFRKCYQVKLWYCHKADKWHASHDGPTIAPKSSDLQATGERSLYCSIQKCGTESRITDFHHCICAYHNIKRMILYVWYPLTNWFKGVRPVYIGLHLKLIVLNIAPWTRKPNMGRAFLSDNSKR